MKRLIYKNDFNAVTGCFYIPELFLDIIKNNS